MITFKKTKKPCMSTEILQWHARHGWTWDVVSDRGREKYIGVMYADVIYGGGAVIHFDGNGAADWLEVLSALRKGVRMVSALPLLFAIVSVKNPRLLRIMDHLGFCRREPFRGVDGDFYLLKYCGIQNAIVSLTKKGDKMGSPKKIKQPDDPDPMPIASSDTTPEVQSAKRNEQKRMAKSSGRTQTILAGNTAQTNGAKKTILGG